MYERARTYEKYIDSEESNIIQHPWFYFRPEETLTERKKGQHLDFSEKLKIYHLHSINGMDSREISAEHNVSLSTIRRIVATFDECQDMTALFKSIRWKRSINYPEVQRWIKEFVDNVTEWFTSNDVFSYVKERLCINIPLHQIRRDLRDTHNLSFKKGRSRPIKLNQRKLILQKQLFWIRLAKEFDNIKVLVNLDECTISR